MTLGQPQFAPYRGQQFSPYAQGESFTPYVGSNPSQPYQFKMDDASVEKAIYSSLPTEIKIQSEVTGTEPQRLVVLDSGLEVPTYLLKRDELRKEVEKIEVKTRKTEVTPLFFSIGVFASESPFQATVMALGIGSLLAKLYLKFTENK